MKCNQNLINKLNVDEPVLDGDEQPLPPEINPPQSPPIKK